ncbi:MAG TPA: TylF/MycF/NovP-related O-methyltransferase [Solirubrobacteraceae bacterium]
MAPPSPTSTAPGDRLPTPAPGAEALRTAYLELLKLSLCDLAGAGTREVRWTGDRRVFWRSLTDEQQLAHRREGKDWPLDGLTMVGLARLGDLQRCVETIVAEGVPGDLIEAGAWRGGASILIRATLDSLGAAERTLWVADSFRGFPPADENAAAASSDRELEAHLSRIGYLAPSLDTVRQYFARFGVDGGVRFVPGFFEETMDGLRGGSWALIRLDADTYRATRLSLEALYDGLAPGGYVIVDDYFHPYLPDSCRRAIDEFREGRGIEDPVEQIDWNGARWRKTAASRPGPGLDPPASPALAADRRPASGSAAIIPSDRELQLQDQLAALRSQLDAAHRELARLNSSAVGRLAQLAGRRARGPE